MTLAKMYGKNAYHNGLSCIPSHDNKFMSNCIVGLKVGESTPFLKEWIAGWTEENLKR